jgi:hypothetical protein
MTGDSTGVSTIDPAFMAAVRQEVMGQGPEEQPEIAQRQAAPEAPQDSTTQALMSVPLMPAALRRWRMAVR